MNDSTHPEVIRCASSVANLCEFILAILGSPTVQAIGRRLGLLAHSAVIPTSGQGNMLAVAAMMDMSKRGVEDLLDRNNVPFTKPGDERIYEFADVARKFEKPAPVVSNDPNPGEMLRPRCAKKNPRPPRGKRQGKK